MEMIAFGYGFVATFIGSCLAMMGMLYAVSPALREDIKQELMR